MIYYQIFDTTIISTPPHVLNVDTQGISSSASYFQCNQNDAVSQDQLHRAYAFLRS